MVRLFRLNILSPGKIGSLVLKEASTGRSLKFLWQNHTGLEGEGNGGGGEGEDGGMAQGREGERGKGEKEGKEERERESKIPLEECSGTLSPPPPPLPLPAQPPPPPQPCPRFPGQQPGFFRHFAHFLHMVSRPCCGSELVVLLPNTIYINRVFFPIMVDSEPW